MYNSPRCDAVVRTHMPNSLLSSKLCSNCFRLFDFLVTLYIS